jgi:hypothetical protein
MNEKQYQELKKKIIEAVPEIMGLKFGCEVFHIVKSSAEKSVFWKKIRDTALENMVKFKELGDDEKASACLDIAVKANNLRTEIESIKLSKNCKII